MNDRDIAIREIRSALKRRSGKNWSVSGGRGTAWGWIRITAPPARRVGFGSMSDTDRADLAELLGLDPKNVSVQGESIPAQADYRAEYIDRANGRTPARTGVPQWD